jgi:hypothetical protein
MWDCVNVLIRAGLTAQVAIDKIYEVYGKDKPTTYILERMRADRRSHGMHPDLLPPGMHQLGAQNRGNRRERG